jgi:hypothetical protein
MQAVFIVLKNKLLQTPGKILELVLYVSLGLKNKFECFLIYLKRIHIFYRYVAYEIIYFLSCSAL